MSEISRRRRSWRRRSRIWYDQPTPFFFVVADNLIRTLANDKKCDELFCREYREEDWSEEDGNLGFSYWAILGLLSLVLLRLNGLTRALFGLTSRNLRTKQNSEEVFVLLYFVFTQNSFFLLLLLFDFVGTVMVSALHKLYLFLCILQEKRNNYL